MNADLRPPIPFDRHVPAMMPRGIATAIVCQMLSCPKSSVEHETVR